MSPIYQQNLSYIAPRWPSVACELDNANIDDLDFDVIEKKSVTLSVNGIQLCSAYDPLEEAFNYRSLTSGNHYHIFGLALGHVPALLCQDASAEQITVYLYNLPLAKLALSVVEMPWLSDPRVTLEILSEDGPNMVNQLAMLSHTGAIVLTGDKQISMQSHQWLFFRMENKVVMSHVNRNYMGRDDELIKIEQQNYPLLKPLKVVDEYLRKYSADKVICVGAGPSLAAHIAELKYVYNQANKPAIVAAATACKCLLENGIKPDVVVAVDIDIPESYIPFHIANDTIFLFASRIKKSIINRWQGEKYYLHLADETYDRFAQQLPSEARLFIYGSVIHPLIHSVLIQGAKQIKLIGCDFGFPGEIIHASMANNPSDHNTSMDQWIENGHGELIKTSATYRMFASGVETLIAANPQCEFINWSRMGAKVYGARYLDEIKEAQHA
jgi:hypothetical protein